MSFAVQTPVYEGPFDLLLHLILKDQVDLYEVSLTSIVDAYLAELEHLEECNLEIATEFLLIASTLIELKVRRLLPDDDSFSLDDELVLWEERDFLLARLLECKTFKDAARQLEALALDASRSFPRTAGLEPHLLELTPDLLAGVTPAQLRAAYERAVQPRPVVRLDAHHIAPLRMSVAEAVQELVEELPRLGRVSFRRLTEPFVDRLEVVIRFLAILELYKQGHIDLSQVANFGEIEITWTGGGHLAPDLVAVDVYEG
jgi:segregation and condensation protein A